MAQPARLRSCLGQWLRRNAQPSRPARRRLALEELEARQLLDGGGLASNPVLASQFVTVLYHDLLQRTPSTGEVAAWQNLITGGLPADQVANAFVSSTEYRSNLIVHDYQTLLGRTPSAAEINVWLNALQGGLGEQGMAAGFLASGEYFSRHGGTITGWLTGVYEDCLGRAPDAGGLRLWGQQLQQGASCLTVALAIDNSPESGQCFVRHTYQSILGRLPGAQELSAAVTDMELGVTTTQFLVAVVSSGELLAQASRTQLTLANIQFTAGWATFGEALPQGFATTGLALGNLPTQTDVKTRWADGSIRFAVVTAQIPAAGVYALHAAAATTGSFTPQLPAASVQFTIGTTLYVAALPSTPSSDVWLSGPLVVESRSVVRPVAPDGTLHPFLDVVFDVRSYNDGTNQLAVTVENDLDVAGASTLTYNVAILANGQTLFQQSNVTHYYLTRWRETFDVGLTESQVTLDLTPFYQANALPRYLSSVANTVNPISGGPPTAYPWATQPRFNILQGGDLDYYMPDHGGRPELGPYPAWVATYLVHQNPLELAYLLKNGDLAGSWPVHVQEPDASGGPSGALVSIDQRPNYWLDPRAAVGNKPAGTPLPDPQYIHFGPTDPVLQSPLVPDNAHVPSLAYAPYLSTGDRYYADEMKYWADFALIKTSPLEGRNGSAGLLGPGNEVRGFGWTLRNLADAAAYLPDSDPMKGYFAQKVENNLQWLDTWAQQNTGPLGVAWIRPSSTMFEGDPQHLQVWDKSWMDDYLAWAVGHANQAGFQGGDLWMNEMLRFDVSLFNSPGWNPANGCPYVLALGANNPNGTVTYYTTLSQVYAHTYANPDASKPISWYGGITRIMLCMAAKQNMSGALSALAYLNPLVVQPLQNQAEFALQ
jgi:hypothetical protein